MKRRALAAFLLGAALVALVTLQASAQRIDPRRPAVFVVGRARGSSPTQRGDSHRSGTAPDPLPAGPLRVAWRKSLALTLDQPVLAAERGALVAVSTRGDVVFLDGDGQETSRASSGATSVGPATLTSDGTVVFVSSAGDAVGLRASSSRPRFVRRIGGERNPRAAPLSLDDGGVVVATMTDLVVLDAEGNVRTRATVPDAPAVPLLATGDRVIAVTAAGLVYGWTPGRDVVQLGSFGAPIDGGATLVETSGHSILMAVVEGNQLVELDLVRGARSTRSIAAQGLYLGPPSARTTVTDGGVGALATLLAQTASLAFVVTVDPSGQETLRAPIATLTPATLADGGPAPLVARAHTGPLIDPGGAAAYASPDGRVGVVSANGAVAALGELICPAATRSAGVAGLTASGGGGFVVSCEGGVIAKVVGPDAGALRPRPSPLSPLVPRRSASPDGDPDKP